MASRMVADRPPGSVRGSHVRGFRGGAKSSPQTATQFRHGPPAVRPGARRCNGAVTARSAPWHTPRSAPCHGARPAYLPVSQTRWQVPVTVPIRCATPTGGNVVIVTTIPAPRPAARRLYRSCDLHGYTSPAERAGRGRGKEGGRAPGGAGAVRPVGPLQGELRGVWRVLHHGPSTGR